MATDLTDMTPPQDSLQSRMDAAVGDLAEPAELIEASLRHLASGELYFLGERFRARVCVFEGRMAWVYCSTHNEHLGDVLERSVGLGADLLTRAMHESRRRNLKLGEWLVDEGLVSRDRLRSCLLSHLAAHLRALAFTTGEFELEFIAQRHRYDASLTFTLDEVIAEAVFGRARTALPFADTLVLIDSRDGRIVGSECRDEKLDEPTLVGLANRVQRFGIDVGRNRSPSVFRGDDVVFCVQPLHTHARLWLGAATHDPNKVGLMVGRTISLEGTI